MKRSQLSDMSVFVEVARCNGFRAAADRLKIGPGSVSEAIQRFEDRLGVRLLDRTTRSIALTTAGEQLYRRSLPAIDDLENAIKELDEQPGVVSGTLRLTAPRSSGMFFLDTLITEYAATYPNVKIELIYDDQKVDLATRQIDAAIRSQQLLDEGTYALPIGPKTPMCVVASPDYLKSFGTPKHPYDLAHHDGICFAFGSPENLAQWIFEGNNGLYSAMPKQRITVNDLSSMLTYCEAGLGLSYTYAKAVETLVKRKQLATVLTHDTVALPQFSINYLTKRHMPARLRAFIDMAKCLK